MDELKENELIPDEEGAAPEEVAPPSEEADEGLALELENIRDLLQKELDAAKDGGDTTYESPTGEVLIQSLDDMGLEFDSADPEREFADETVEEEEIDEEDLCQCCGEKRRNTDHGEDYPYCEDCRNLMLHNPLNFVGVFVSIIVCLVAGLSIGLMVSNISDYSTLIDAETAYDSKNLSTALVSYLEYADAADVEGVYSKAAIKHCVEVLSTLGHYTYAEDYVEKFFSDTQLKLPWNSKLKKTLDHCKELSNTDDYINENIGELIQSRDYDKAIEKIDKAIEENKEKTGEEALNQVYLGYIKYFLLYSNNADRQEVLDTLIGIRDLDEKSFGGENKWMYITYLIRQYGQVGDFENAKKYFDLSLEENKQDVNSYVFLADAYRFTLNKDSSAEEIASVAEEITKLGSECENSFERNFSYPTYYRIYAIAHLLNNETEDAMTAMDSYLNESSGNMSIADFSLYCICAIESGNKDKYQQIKDYFDGYGYSLSKAVEKLQKGKTTVYDILIDKGGDI